MESSLDLSEIKEDEANQSMISISQALLDELEGKSLIKIKIDKDVLKHLSNVLIEEISHNSYQQPKIVDYKFNEYVDELIKLFKLMIEYDAKATDVTILQALTGDDIPKEGQNNINHYFLSFKSFYRIDLIKGFFSLGIDIYFVLLLSRRSGDIEILRIRPKLYYKNSKQISKGITLNRLININLTSINFSMQLFNNVLGKEGNRKCACESCIYCDKLSSENKKLCELYKPFEDIRLHINELNEYDSSKIDMTPAYTFIKKKKNKVDKLNQFCCSFCNDESATTLRKVFFHNQNDNDHNCYFYFCEYCFESREDEDILCPNCEQFIVNFYHLNYIRPSYLCPY